MLLGYPAHRILLALTLALCMCLSYFGESEARTKRYRVGPCSITSTTGKWGPQKTYRMERIRCGKVRLGRPFSSYKNQCKGATRRCRFRSSYKLVSRWKHFITLRHDRYTETLWERRMGKNISLKRWDKVVDVKFVRWRTFNLRTGKPVTLQQLFPKKANLILRKARIERSRAIHRVAKKLHSQSFELQGYHFKKKRFSTKNKHKHVFPVTLQSNRFALLDDLFGRKVVFFANVWFYYGAEGARVIAIPIPVYLGKKRSLASAGKEFLKSWAKAWSQTTQSNNFHPYSRLYHKDFQESRKRKRKRKAFLSYKRKVGKRLRWIRVTARDVQTRTYIDRIDEDIPGRSRKRITLEFLQQYECPRLFDVGKKTLELKQGLLGQWQIRDEVWTRDPKAELFARWNRTWRRIRTRERRWSYSRENEGISVSKSLTFLFSGKRIKSIRCETENTSEMESTSASFDLYPNGRPFRVYQSSSNPGGLNGTTYVYTRKGRHLSKYSVRSASKTSKLPDSSKARRKHKARLKRYKALFERLRRRRSNQLPATFSCF